MDGQVEVFRQSDNGAAIAFLHGFSATNAAWGNFPSFSVNEPQLRGWDVFGITYSTSKKADVPFWSADPDITALAVNLRTILQTPPLNRYKALSLIAHSMGGLVAQKAILVPSVQKQIAHLFLFGTPSLGLRKASLIGPVKRQVRDMKPNSPFIKQLRAEWKKRFEHQRGFRLSVIAGGNDVFVPLDSVFGPFIDEETKNVPGDHVTMTLPSSPSATAVRVVTEGLLGHGLLRDAADSAAIAIERGQFRELVDQYYPNSQPLEHGVAVNVALALDALGRGDEAIALLELIFERPSDATGTLAGRYKRKWLADGAAEHWKRARDLYIEAYEIAVRASDEGQAMYHAINIAFLDAMHAPSASAVPQGSQERAKFALAHAATSKQDH